MTALHCGGTVFSALFLLLVPLTPARLSWFTRYPSVFVSGYLRNDVQLVDIGGQEVGKH